VRTGLIQDGTGQVRGSSPHPLLLTGCCWSRLSTLQAYQAGQWDIATEVLSRCLTSRRDAAGAVLEDGPSRVLLEYMKQYNCVAPTSWRGFRELTEK
jgi:hypothetical protein